jgi:imidazolonepropionase-like amidohydrolase
VLEAGAGSRVFNRLDSSIFQAIAEDAHARGLPLVVHTGDVRDVTDAVSAGADSIEHGSFREPIPDSLFQQMLSKKTFYDPTLSIGEAFRDFAAGKTDLLKRSLVQQVGPADLIEKTEKAMASTDTEPIRQRIAQFPLNLDMGTQNLLRASKNGVALVTGTDAGNYLIFHGPTVQHELALWVRAGIPPAVALQAATYNAARLLRAENRIGSIRVGNDADLLLVDGNPLDDITAVERISIVVFKGEQLDRSDLFSQE